MVTKGLWGEGNGPTATPSLGDTSQPLSGCLTMRTCGPALPSSLSPPVITALTQHSGGGSYTSRELRRTSSHPGVLHWAAPARRAPNVPGDAGDRTNHLGALGRWHCVCGWGSPFSTPSLPFNRCAASGNLLTSSRLPWKVGPREGCCVAGRNNVLF